MPEKTCIIPEKNVHVTPEISDTIENEVKDLILKINENEGSTYVELKVLKSKIGYLQSINIRGDVLDNDEDTGDIVKEIEKILNTRKVIFEVYHAFHGNGIDFKIPYF